MTDRRQIALTVLLMVGILAAFATFLFALFPKERIDPDGMDDAKVQRTVIDGADVVCVIGRGLSPEMECWRDGEPGAGP
jgi:hypothetical protein